LAVSPSMPQGGKTSRRSEGKHGPDNGQARGPADRYLWSLLEDLCLPGVRWVKPAVALAQWPKYPKSPSERVLPTARRRSCTRTQAFSVGMDAPSSGRSWDRFPPFQEFLGDLWSAEGGIKAPALTCVLDSP
jgi:hypothetical protein